MENFQREKKAAIKAIREPGVDKITNIVYLSATLKNFLPIVPTTKGPKSI